jgi:hypothetical protein
MGEMIYKELVMLIENNYWQYIMDISKSTFLNLETVEQAIEFLNIEYSNISFDLEINENEIYILTQDPIPCVNCQQSK